MRGFEKELTAKTSGCCGNASGRHYVVRNFMTLFWAFFAPTVVGRDKVRCSKGTEYFGFIGEMRKMYEILVVETDVWAK